MDNRSVLVVSVIFPLGIVLLILAACMYDILQKNSPDEEQRSDILYAFKKIFQIFYFAPFFYLKMSIKKKRGRGILIGLLYWIILLFAFIWGNYNI